MRTISLCVLLGTLQGCVDSSPSSVREDSAPEEPVTVTANRPIGADPTRSSDTFQADNTAVNVRDREDGPKTPADQFENADDIDITARIRSRVVGTDMSVAAQNIKIITQYGRVTLRGPVRSQQEKQRVEDIAKSVAGSENVESQLEVVLK